MNWNVADGQLPFSALVTIQIDGGKPSSISGVFSIGTVEGIPRFLASFAAEDVPMRQYLGVLFREDEFFDRSQYKPGKVLFIDPSENAYVDRLTAFEMAVAYGEGTLKKAKTLPTEEQPGEEWEKEMGMAIEALREKVEQEKSVSEA